MTTDATPAENSGDIVAKASFEYRIKRYLIVVMLIVMAGWFGYDGWVGYPRKNAEFLKHNPEGKPPETNLSITIQKTLAIGLPFIAVGVLVWTLYNSRGVYRLSGKTLHVPGHPPVPLDSIVRIDKKLWDRKGIVFFDYEDAAGAKGRLRLDDFIYERVGTDKIFDEIKRELLPDEPATNAPAAGEEAANT